MAPPPPPPAAEAGTLRIWLAIGLGGLAGVVLVGVIALAVLARGNDPGPPAAVGGGAAEGTALPEAAAEGSRAPQFTLPDLTGHAISLRDFRGHPVWVNIWASWCGPCRAEMPEMQQKYDKYQGQGLVIIGVDFREEAPTVQGFITQNGYDWTFLLDKDGGVGEHYGATGIPVHAFIDRSGVIRGYQVGGMPPTIMESYLARILP